MKSSSQSKGTSKTCGYRQLNDNSTKEYDSLNEAPAQIDSPETEEVHPLAILLSSNYYSVTDTSTLVSTINPASNDRSSNNTLDLNTIKQVNQVQLDIRKECKDSNTSATQHPVPDWNKNSEDPNIAQELPKQSQNINNNNDRDLTGTDRSAYSSPHVMLRVFYNSGTLWVHVGKAINLDVSGGKLYVKTYLLPDDTGTSKQKSLLVEGTTDPTFNATMSYFLEEDETPTRILSVSIWKKEIHRKVFLGVTRLPLVNFDLRNASDCWYSITNAPSLKVDYKLVTKLPPVIKVALLFEPNADCHDMDGKGTLKICAVRACNLSSLSRVTNLSRVRAFCSLLPGQLWATTRKKTAKYEIGSNPIWSLTFKYANMQLQHLLDEVAADISIADANDFIGRIRLGAYPTRAKKHEPYMDYTEKESAHWEEMLSNPGKQIERWHWISESLEDREADLSVKPPVFITPSFVQSGNSKQDHHSQSKNPLTQLFKGMLKQQQTESSKAEASSSSPLKKDSEVPSPTKFEPTATTVTVGKLLAGVYYKDEYLTVHLDQVSGLCGGVTKKKTFNPYLKVCLLQQNVQIAKKKTSTKHQTRSPVFDETFKYLIEDVEKMSITGINVSVWHRPILGKGEFVGEVDIPLPSSKFLSDRWYNLVQSITEHRIIL